MSIATGVVWIEEQDIGTQFSASLSSFAGFPGILGGADRQVTPIAGPESFGGLVDPHLTVRLPTSSTNTPTMGLLIQGATVTDGVAALDALKAICNAAQVRLRTAFAPDRYVLATVQAMAAAPHIPDVLNGLFDVTLQCVVADGVAWATMPDGYGLSATKVACPLGTAESYPTILIHGGGASLTNPTITYRDASGQSVTTMSFTVSLGANDVLRVDSRRATVSKVAAGTITDGLAAGYWGTGDGDFPILRPADSGFDASAWPTLEVSAATGAPQGSVSYVRAYA